MKNIFLVLILIPLFINIKIPFTDWEWDWNIDWDINSFWDQIKTGVPEFLNKIKEDIKNFLTLAESKQREKIEELKNNAINTYNQLKNTTEKQYQQLIEKTTEAAKYLSYKVCNATDMPSYEDCRDHKKEVFEKLIDMVHEEFQCSRIIDIITGTAGQIIKEDSGESSKYLLILLNSITSNADAIRRGKAQIVYDLVNCTKDQIFDNWPKIEEHLKNKGLSLEYKKDITNLLIQSMENLAGVLHFEDLDGYIEEYDNVTGLIKNKKAKDIHKNIFNMLEKLNEYGSQFYNFSSNIAVNVTVKPDEKQLNISNEIVSDFPEKGIKISYYADYLLDKYNAKYIQCVVFDSPMVSVRGRKEDQGGTSNTFVGLTLYDSNGKEIFVKEIDTKRPIIYYKKKLFKAMTKCLFYNEEANMIEDTGVETQIANFNGEEFIKCIPKHLTSFTIGSYSSAPTSDEGTDNSKNSDNNSGSNAGTIILIIVLCLIALGLIVGFYLFWRKRSQVNSSQLNQAFPNKDGLLS
jgi:hypothetical protein